MCQHHVLKCTTLNIPVVHIWIYYSCILHILFHLLYTHLCFTEFTTVHTAHSLFSHTYVTCQCSHKYCNIACIYLYTNCSWIHTLSTIFIPLYLIHRHTFCRWLQIQILNFSFDFKNKLALVLSQTQTALILLKPAS